MAPGRCPRPVATVHVIGAGIAGLACAVRLVGRGRRVALYEAAGHAGGRSRSFFEPALGRTIDNGNHLLLGGNDAVMAYLDEIGARGGLRPAPEIAFPFLDLTTGARWTIRPNRGRLPWWLFAPARRAPGTRPADYLAGLRFARARPGDTVADVLDPAAPIFARFWGPLTVAVLNAAPDEAAARPFWPVVRLTFGRGGEACRPYAAPDGLSASLVDPAVAWLAMRGTKPAFARRLRGIGFGNGRATALFFADGELALAEDDAVVLAVPPARIGEMLPEITVPRESRAIVNAHYRLTAPVTLPGGSPLLGLIGGAAQWVFLRGDVASVTVSAADALAEEPSEDIAETLWRDVARALELGNAPLPAHRVVKERRATFAQTPAETARRPSARTRWPNLFLAGDWTDTGLPATVESAALSGHTAARLACIG